MEYTLVWAKKWANGTDNDNVPLVDGQRYRVGVPKSFEVKTYRLPVDVESDTKADLIEELTQMKWALNSIIERVGTLENAEDII